MRAHAADPPAAEQAHDVDLMRALAEQHATALRGVEFFRPARPHHVIGVVQGVDHPHRAIDAAVDQFARMQDRRIEAVAVPDHQLNAGPLHGIDDGAAFLEPDRDRLFDQHMLAAGGGGDHMSSMHLMRGRDIDRLDRRIVAQSARPNRRWRHRSQSRTAGALPGGRSVAATSSIRGSAAKVGNISVKARPSPAMPRRMVANGHVCYRSITRSGVFARDTQIMIWLPRSASVSTRSRWSASPAISLVRQVPQVPLSHELGTS